LLKKTDIFSLEGKVGYVTGSGQGIGKVLAVNLAAFGAAVAVADINEKTAQETCDEILAAGGNAIAIKTDVTDPDSVGHMISTIDSKWGRLDFAVNNAGGGNTIPAIELSKKDFMWVVELNMCGVFLTSQASAKYMKERGGGSIINTASMSAYIVNVPQTISVYNASKAGCKHLTKSMAVEWAQYGIRVNSISPGYMMTELTSILHDMHPVWIEKIPLSRIGNPEDLVGAVIYLASDASRYATGTDIIVDGGYTCL
jgi:NAD(P)-dependent dehydrogenase (short-subunit alcohol dehydrogenase family)